ncbi:MAG: hypothetical protein AB1489_26815, partial [Acidobacteriota bacterium]
LPKDAPPLTESIELLKQSRATLLEILSKTTVDELASISIPHPLKSIGNITGVGWISLIAYHEIRHINQLQELRSQ